MSHEVVCFQMLDFGTSKSNSEVSNLNSSKITSFSIITLLQREPFSTQWISKYAQNNKLNWCRSCEIIMEDKHPCHTKLCAFRCSISGPQNFILKVSKSNSNSSGKLLLSRKLRYFRGSRFSQSFILSTSLHCLSPSRFCMQTIIE